MNNCTKIKKSDCTGCSACRCVCPVGAIIMSVDNEGFLYPNIDNQCVNCGMCLKICPSENKEIEKPIPQTAYIVQNKDETVLAESTSGGAFTAIAQYVIERGGIVYGAAFDLMFRVTHQSAETIDDLRKFRNSKYAQSEMGSVINEIKIHLDNNRLVLFSGTPCQAAAVRTCVAYNVNMIIIDVVCRAVPSPKVLLGYLDWQKQKYGEIGAFKFRDKKPYGYKYTQASIYNKDGKQIYHSGIDTDVMLRAFFSNICDRPACYTCKFKQRYRNSDFTIWDCFNPSLYYKPFDNDRGVTNVLLHTEKARQIFECVDSLKMVQTNPDILCPTAYEMTHCVTVNPMRQNFFADLNSMEFEEVVGKYFPDNAKVKLHRNMRRIFINIGLYLPMLRLFKRLKGVMKIMQGFIHSREQI